MIRHRTARTLGALVLLCCLIPVQYVPRAAAAGVEGFAHSSIRARWSSDDGAVASGAATRPWLWGPGPFYTTYEPYEGTPQGNHLVQYFDKGRLEVNDPAGDRNSPWFVTSGLLVKEMVSGRAQTGEATTYSIGPARVPVAGDAADSSGPTYATFSNLTGRVDNREGRDVTTQLSRAGSRTELASPPVAVKLARFEPASGHNWADVFWAFATSPNRPAHFDWLPTLGYPITEPYWASVTVNGQQRLVLVQLFERRVLTFNPANPQSLQVEMGNAGRHYYRWRYGDLDPALLGAKYDVKIQVGPAPTRATHVDEQIEFTNSTGAPLTSAMFRVVWHNWNGVFTLQSASASGQSAQTIWREGVNLEVGFPAPVAAGAKASVALSFSLKPRPVGGRTGYDRTNDILSLGDMLPTLVPWENGGWEFYPYSDLGDLGYYETSSYSVEVASTSGERLIVGGTGQISGVSADRTRYVFDAPNVRDVAYVVSPRFVDPLNDSSMRRTSGATELRAYFLPEHRTQAQRQLDLVTPAFTWYNKAVGAYPFGSFTVAEMGVVLERTDNYAQEYPMAYFVPTGWLSLGNTPGTWTWYTPFHEVGHQWFYSTIGSNQLTDPWLDEAMTSYISAEYVRAAFPDQYARAYGSMSANTNTSKPVSSGVYSGFANENEYSATIYDQGVRMLQKIRLQMGDAAFYDALRGYYKTYTLKRATPAALLAAFQAHTNTDLTPIFSAYLGY